MEGTKAVFLESLCKEAGRQFTRFDYFGHGKSSGDILQGSIGRWREDALVIFDDVTSGPQILVGSSMGGWIMLLVASQRPQRIAALVGIASAPDFTQKLLTDRLDSNQKKELSEIGYVDLTNEYDDREPYRITRSFLKESEQHWVLNGDIEVHQPVRLLHGLKDQDVPWQSSIAIIDRLQSSDVELQLVEMGDHRLSTQPDLDRLATVVRQLAAQCGEAISE